MQPAGQPDMDYRFWRANETAIGGLMATPEPDEAPGLWPGWLDDVVALARLREQPQDAPGS